MFLSQPGSTSFYTPISFKQWETGMVCVDTSMSKITLVNRTNTYSTIFPNFSNTGQWFAYLDCGGSAISSVSINLGLNPFYNKLPSGYIPWLYTSLNVICKTQTLHLFPHIQLIHVLILTCIS